jgi:hypothetical protein
MQSNCVFERKNKVNGNLSQVTIIVADKPHIDIVKGKRGNKESVFPIFLLKDIYDGIMSS